MIYTAPDFALDEDGILPRRYHNAPITVFGFPTPETLQLILGGTISQIAGTNSEFYTITNMSDPVRKADLHVRISGDFMPMVIAGGPGDLLDQVTLPYGATGTFSKTSNAAAWIFVNVQVPAQDSEDQVKKNVPLWPVVWTQEADIDLRPGFVTAASGATSANLPIDAEVGTQIIVKSVSPNAKQIKVNAGEGQTVDAGSSVNVGAFGSGTFIFVGDNHWIRCG